MRSRKKRDKVVSLLENTREIDLVKKNSTFLRLKIIVDTLIDVKNETLKNT